MMQPSPLKNSPDQLRQKAEQLGRWAEKAAEIMLRCKFYAIKEHRYKCPVGEIDLIAQRGKNLVFIEVKMRADKRDFPQALESVNQSRIIAAANHYVANHPQVNELNMRFDVILVAPGKWPTHMSDAFRP